MSERTPQQGVDDLNTLLAQAVNVVDGRIATAVNPGSSVAFRYTNPISGETLTATGIALTPCPPTRVTALRTDQGDWFVVGANFARQVREQILTVRHGRTQPQTKGKIKYLYSLVADGQIRFYVGGWQQRTILATTLPDSATILHASIDNLGGSRWSLNLAYRLDGMRTIARYEKSTPEWAYTDSDSSNPTCYRNGFWLIGSTAGDNQTTTTPTISEPCESEVTVTSAQNSTIDYLYEAAAKHTASQSTLIDYSYGHYLTQTTDAFGNVTCGPPVVNRFSNSRASVVTKLIVPAIDFTITETASHSHSYSTYTDEFGNPPVISGDTTVDHPAVVYSLAAINQKGTSAIAQKEGRLVFFNHTQETDSTLTEVPGFLDVFDTEFTLISPGDQAFALTNNNRNVALTHYSSAFEHYTKREFVYKPSKKSGSGYQFYNASYHT